MRSILIPITDEEGLKDRSAAGIAITQEFGGNLTFLHGTPVSQYIAADPFGGAFYLKEHREAVLDGSAARRAQATEIMKGHDIKWKFVESSGSQEEVLVEHSRLADLIIVSEPASWGSDDTDAAALITYLVMAAECPVLAVPDDGRKVEGGKAIVAWNGSPPAGKSLRASVPLLSRASEVSIVTFGEDPEQFPAESAAVYLARYDIEAKVSVKERSGDVAKSMQELLISEGADLLVMGAYSHSRVREFVFGGVSRHFIRRSPVPVFLAH